MYGMFHLLRFPTAELPDVIYGENLTSAFYLDKPTDVAAYTEALDRLCAQASPVVPPHGRLPQRHVRR